MTVLTGRDLASGRPVTVHVVGEWIAAVDPVADADQPLWIGAGLVDLQINGFAGLDLNRGDLVEETVVGLTRTLWSVGVTTFLPTLVTADEATIEAGLRAIAAAVGDDPVVARAVAGIHLEGPFISPEDGPRGAHAPAHVRPPDWGLFERWQVAAGGRIKVVTLAPEWPGALEFIARCRARGVTAAIGHTAATPGQVRAAVAAGARLSTHLGNGTHPTLPRHPNHLWEQLASDELWASVIADGFHLPEAVLKVVLRVKGERALLVSDAVALAGLPPGAYASPIGERVVLTPEGRLHLVADPRLLAGSARPLIAGVAHLVRSGLASLDIAWAAASTRPAALLDLPVRAGLAAGAPADLVLFRWDGREIGVERVYKAGELVYARGASG